MKVFNALRLALLCTVSCFALGVQAGTVEFTPADTDITVSPGSTVTMDIVGSAFSGNLDGGDWGATWDASVLSFVSLTVDAVWDSVFSDETNVGTGHLDFVFLGFTPAAGLPSPFGVATLEFTAAGSGNTTVALDNGLGSGWPLTGGGNEPSVTYGTSDVDIGVVPVPAAVWLFGSALGLLGFVRRRMLNVSRSACTLARWNSHSWMKPTLPPAFWTGNF